MAKVVLKVKSDRSLEMQRNPQEYFRNARALAKKQAEEQIKAEQRREDKRLNANGRTVAFG